MLDTKGHSFDREIILLNVRWYQSYRLSNADLAEMAAERGVSVNRPTINRWVIKFTPAIEASLRKRRREVSSSWRMDETYFKVKGEWKHLYRAVDDQGQTVDYLFTAKRDKKAAIRIFKKAIKSSGRPEIIVIDKSGSNTAALEAQNAESDVQIKICQSKYLNNIVEQDHRAIKNLFRPTKGFETMKSVAITLAGFEVMHMLRKGQIGEKGLSRVEAFHSIIA